MKSIEINSLDELDQLDIPEEIKEIIKIKINEKSKLDIVDSLLKFIKDFDCENPLDLICASFMLSLYSRSHRKIKKYFEKQSKIESIELFSIVDSIIEEMLVESKKLKIDFKMKQKEHEKECEHCKSHTH